MSMLSISTGSKNGLTRSFIFSIIALSLSGCALGPIGGAALSLASGTMTAASDITSNVVGSAVDATAPDSGKDTTN